MTASDGERWGSWEDAEDFALEASLRATPQQRLDWLAAALEVARKSGALARAREERMRREREMWEGKD